MMKKEQADIFWNSREFAAFIDNVNDEAMRLVFELCYHNGIAIQDALLLTIKDFNIHKGCIAMNNARMFKEQIGDREKINLPESYQVDMLEGQKEVIETYLGELAEYEKDECVFQMSQQRLEREFCKVIEKATLRKMQMCNLPYFKRHIYYNSTNGKMHCLKGYSDEEVSESMNGNRMEVTRKGEVPIWKKLNLTLAEAAVYSGIGINNLRKLCDENEERLVLWIGSKRLIKRKKLEELTEQIYVI